MRKIRPLPPTRLHAGDPVKVSKDRRHLTPARTPPHETRNAFSESVGRRRTDLSGCAGLRIGATGYRATSRPMSVWAATGALAAVAGSV
jgi:hypothetical protein